MRLSLLPALLALTSFAADIHVRNFATVNEHLLRGSEPTAEGLKDLSAAGAKLIIDLREPGPGTLLEKQRAEKLGMQYRNIPFHALTAPTADQMRIVLNLLAANKTQTVFVHCRRGKDRTGTVIACYRIQHDGWNNDRALEEARQHGMSPIERGMRSFILHFTPASNSADPILLTQ